MAKKKNIRSIRFSDEIIEIIEAQEGETFTAKFETLIRKCYQEIPAKEQELNSLNRAIKERREQLGRMTNKCESYRRRLQSMDQNIFQLEKQIAIAQEHEW